MRTTWILACTLVLFATAGVAQQPDEDGMVLAAILNPPVASSSCARPESGFRLAAAPSGGSTKAICIADCGSGTSVYCSYASPTTCTAVDRNCSSGQRGYVTCGTSTTYCPYTCPCIEGTYRYLLTGYCCDDGRREKEQQICTNGGWQYTGVLICSGICGPLEPRHPDYNY